MNEALKNAYIRKNALGEGVIRWQVDGSEPSRTCEVPPTHPQQRIMDANGGSNEMPTVNSNSIRSNKICWIFEKAEHVKQ